MSMLCDLYNNVIKLDCSGRPSLNYAQDISLFI